MKKKLLLLLVVLSITNLTVFLITRHLSKSETVSVFTIDEIECNLTNYPFKGSPGAPVTLIEYSDFECKYHNRMQQVMDTVFRHFGDTLKFYFKPRPIIKEKVFWLRSKALLASLKQNRFWEMETALSKIGTEENTDNEKNRMENHVMQCVESLHLDLALFKMDLYSKETERELEAIIAETEKYGITTYPFLFINKRPVLGVRSSDYYIKKIHKVISSL